MVYRNGNQYFISSYSQAIKEKVVQEESVAFREKFFTHALENRQVKRKKKMENFQKYQMKMALQNEEMKEN